MTEQNIQHAAVEGLVISRPDDPYTQIEMITPDIAKAMLATSSGNRNDNPSRIVSYMTEMKEGRWGLASDCIQFDVHGQLRNGHHRLQALVLADVSLRFNVMRNCPEEMFFHTDTGLPRSLADFLSIKGWPQSRDLASVTAKWWAYVRNNRRVSAQALKGGLDKGRFVLQCSIDSGVATAEQYGDFLMESIRFLGARRKGLGVLGIHRSVAVFIHAAWSETDRPFSDDFWDKVTSGYSRIASDPAIALRNALIDQRQNAMARREIYPPMAIWQMTARAMQASYKGERLSTVKHAAKIQTIIQPRP